jgi:hypothetical protein
MMFLLCLKEGRRKEKRTEMRVEAGWQVFKESESESK